MFYEDFNKGMAIFKDNGGKLVNPLFMWGLEFLGISVILSTVDNRLVLPQNSYVQFLIVPAFLYWLYFFTGAARIHSEASRSTNRISKLVEEGVYAKVRHPFYSADIVMIWGIFFYFQSLRVLVTAIWFTLVLVFWMKLEEKYLIKKFGREYEDYKSRVPMAIPKVGINL